MKLLVRNVAVFQSGGSQFSLIAGLFSSHIRECTIIQSKAGGRFPASEQRGISAPEALAKLHITAATSKAQSSQFTD